MSLSGLLGDKLKGTPFTEMAEPLLKEIREAEQKIKVLEETIEKVEATTKEQVAVAQAKFGELQGTVAEIEKQAKEKIQMLLEKVKELETELQEHKKFIVELRAEAKGIRRLARVIACCTCASGTD